MKMKPIVALLLSVLFCAAVSSWGYSTPNTGVSWTMDDLVAHSSGKVTGSAPNYQMHGDVFIMETDTLTIPAGTTITRDDGTVWPALVIKGKLLAQGMEASPILITSGDARGGTDDYDRALEIHNNIPGTGSPVSLPLDLTEPSAFFRVKVQLSDD